MYQKKLKPDIRCPLEHGLEIFGGKWDARIICVLNEKHRLRYSELRKEMINITDAVLSTSLKKLIMAEMIEKEQYNEIPPHVEYFLTEKGKSVVPILQNICQWSGVYYKDVDDKNLKQCQHCDYK